MWWPEWLPSAVTMGEGSVTNGAGVNGARTPTSLLLEPYGPGAVDERTAAIAAARQIPRVLADLAVPRREGGSFRLTDHEVRMAVAGPSGSPRSAASTPFAWSARTARRALGLNAVRALAAGTARNPVDGVRTAIDDAMRAVRQGESSASPMDRWLCGLPASGLAAVQSDSVTWATRLWCGLDWNAFEEVPLIGRDHWWDSPHSSLLALRSRAEVRATARDGDETPFSVHLVVLGGSRRPSVRSELAVIGLVEALRAPRRLLPGRIVGWWPDSGHAVKVEIDTLAVRDGAAAVTLTLAGAGATPPSSEGVSRAAA
jgi:hypothetical protein